MRRVAPTEVKRGEEEVTLRGGKGRVISLFVIDNIFDLFHKFFDILKLPVY